MAIPLFFAADWLLLDGRYTRDMQYEIQQVMRDAPATIRYNLFR